MRTQLASRMSPSPFAPMAPACPHCNDLMSLQSAEPWTLLRGHQLDRYVFECAECGHSITRMVDEDRL